jgi:hypothetical protein
MPERSRAELNRIRDELRAHGVPHDRVDEIMADLIAVGQDIICASLGEIAGGHTIAPATLRLLVATLVAHGK